MWPGVPSLGRIFGQDNTTTKGVRSNMSALNQGFLGLGFFGSGADCQ
jgi:hypothetical protein